MSLPIDNKINALQDMIVKLRRALLKEAGERGYWEHASTADAYEESKELVELTEEEQGIKYKELGITREQYRLKNRIKSNG